MYAILIQLLEDDKILSSYVRILPNEDRTNKVYEELIAYFKDMHNKACDPSNEGPYGSIIY